MKRSGLKLPLANREFMGFALSLVYICVCAFKLIQTYGYAFKVKAIISEARTLFSCFTDLG